MVEVVRESFARHALRFHMYGNLGLFNVNKGFIPLSLSMVEPFLGSLARYANKHIFGVIQC